MCDTSNDMTRGYPFDTDKRILDYPVPLTHGRMMQYIECFRERYPFLEIQNLGCSVLGRNIPVITLGEGERCVLYVGAHRGTEWLTSVLLLRMINEYAEGYRSGRHVCSVYLPYLFRQRRVAIIPMLNPDGVDYVLRGVASDNPLLERLLRMNNGSHDFSHWQANGRGVDLCRNYAFAFEEYRTSAAEAGIEVGASVGFCGESPESEPETAYLCNYLRYHNHDIGALISLHTSGECIHSHTHATPHPRSLPIARVLSRLSGYRQMQATAADDSNGLIDFCLSELQLPAFALYCGSGSSPLPYEQYFCVYAAIRELLFEAPRLI